MIKSWRAKGGNWPQVDEGALIASCVLAASVHFHPTDGVSWGSQGMQPPGHRR